MTLGSRKLTNTRREDLNAKEMTFDFEDFLCCVGTEMQFVGDGFQREIRATWCPKGHLCAMVCYVLCLRSLYAGSWALRHGEKATSNDCTCMSP